MSTRVSAKRILAVENDELVRSFLEAGLATAGYEVDTACNGREALAMLDHGAYDLVISDARMPELDGPGLCRALEERHSDALRRFIFLTTPDSRETHHAFLAAVGAPALTKPICLDDLCYVVEKMLEINAQPC